MYALFLGDVMSKFKLFMKQDGGFDFLGGIRCLWAKTLMMLLLLILSLNVVHANDEMAFIKMRVYLNPAGAPFSFFTDNLKVLHGIDVDIIREMQNRLGFEIVDDRIYPLDANMAIQPMKDKKIDLYGGGLAFHPEFVRNFAALPIYIKSSLGVMFSQTHHPNIKSVQDLKGMRIGIVAGSHAEKFVKQFGGTVEPINNLSYAIFMITQNRLDAIIYDRMILEDFLKTSGAGQLLTVLPDEFGKDLCQYTFYISKLSPYRRLLTSTLQDMLNDGSVNRILAKWGFKIKQPPMRKPARTKTKHVKAS